jgi:hypothetical protein
MRVNLMNRDNLNTVAKSLNALDKMKKDKSLKKIKGKHTKSCLHSVLIGNTRKLNPLNPQTPILWKKSQ